MVDYSFNDSILAIATSITHQALSIIRGSGKNCINILSSVFSNPTSLLSSKGNITHVGWIIKNGKKLDQVVVCVYKAPKSFTGEDSVEIITHGGVYTTLNVYNLLIEKGFREAEAGEFSFRSFLNGKINLTQAEAIKMLTSATNEKEAELAIGQLENHFFNFIESLKQKLISLIAMLDVSIEYPEDEIELEQKTFDLNLNSIIEKIDEALKRWETNKLFIEGAKVVIAGRANAGKSSLFNALINEERSIVSNIPGTTRNYIDTSILFKGLPIKLYDTAGLRHTKNKIEKEGLKQTQKIVDIASLVLYLIDNSKIIDEEDISFLKSLKQRYIIVLTKEDLASSNNNYNILKNALINTENIINISCKTKHGIENLKKNVYSLLIKCESEDYTKNTIISLRQKEMLIKTKKHLSTIKEINLCYMDLIMQEATNALEVLGKITGEVTSQDILNEIFSSFCVGK